MPDGQPAPGSVRPIHRANIHIIEPAGSELWLDVKIHTVAPELGVAKELLRAEQTERRAYGQRTGYILQALDKGMTPVVFAQYGRTAPGHKPSPIGLSIIASSSLSDGECLPHMQRRSVIHQLRAVGPHLLHTAPSSLASTCGLHAKNRPGRSWGHTHTHTAVLATLPLGAPVNERPV